MFRTNDGARLGQCRHVHFVHVAFWILDTAGRS